MRIQSYYTAGVRLLQALAELENDLKHNYEKGDAHQRALATIALLQCDLFSSYIVLQSEDEKGPVVSRAIILRTILENQGAILHVKGNEKRAKSYLAHAKKMQQQVRDHVEGRKTPETDLMWSTSTIKHRVGLISDNAERMYDTLSNFTHGNNTLYFYDTKRLTNAFIKAMDSYYIGMFIGFLAELGIGLDMEDTKRKAVFEATSEVGRWDGKK